MKASAYFLVTVIALGTLSGCAARERLAAKLDERLQFEKIDTDGNGCITPAELDSFKQRAARR